MSASAMRCPSLTLLLVAPATPGARVPLQIEALGFPTAIQLGALLWVVR